jgi:hypothetical protein
VTGNRERERERERDDDDERGGRQDVGDESGVIEMMEGSWQGDVMRDVAPDTVGSTSPAACDETRSDECYAM